MPLDDSSPILTALISLHIKLISSVNASTATPSEGYHHTRPFFLHAKQASLYVSLPTVAYSSVGDTKIKLPSCHSPPIAFLGNCGQYNYSHSDFHLTFILDSSLIFKASFELNLKNFFFLHDRSGEVFPVHPLAYNCSDSLS